ncbi:unnamed protein product [Prunus brigantina]
MVYLFHMLLLVTSLATPVILKTSLLHQHQKHHHVLKHFQDLHKNFSIHYHQTKSTLQHQIRTQK